ncbi:MAG: TetR/AcrR family transcriptional regulator [Chloroflexaceae bacterium]|jgi:AcrR family transcriptional regulator|nr:TetR/AcrR family transcriptional regulator [Chloroflexaceae bacterium]
MRTQAQETRQLLLEAATRVVMEQGANALTLDAVAQAAGVSKGGLLHHFPSKKALISGLIEALLDASDRDMEERIAALGGPETPGVWLRAYVESICVAQPDAANLNVGMLAAIANDPSLLDPVRERFAQWQRRAEADGLDPALGTLIRLAADGLYMADAFGLAPPPEPLRGEVARRLLALVEQQTTG